MKQIVLSVVLALAAAGSVCAQAAPAAADQQVLAAFKEIQVQQAQIAENQAKIEAKLATIAEAVRVAKIYSSRAGH